MASGTEIELRRIRQLLTLVLAALVVLIGLVLLAINLIAPQLDWARVVFGLLPYFLPVPLYFLFSRLHRWSKPAARPTTP